MSWSEISLRVFIALISGCVLGMEREIHHKPAGLRTHILVSLGSALFVLSSVHIFSSYPALGTFDPSRVAAGVVTGIGFLGAGAIMQTKHHIKGLTTAASIWVCSSLGIASGIGAYKVVVIGLAAAIIVLATFYRFESRLDSLENQKQDDVDDTQD
jgi:putative Mg2+ transporter-C (MgtC) family protein